MTRLLRTLLLLPLLGWTGALLASPLVIDVRTPAEYAQGHVAGAQQIDYQQVAARLEQQQLDKSTPIALYCRSGRRAELARQALQAAGFSQVENLGSLQQAAQRLAQPIIP